MGRNGDMGWIGLDAPVEIIAAAGYRPVRLDPDPLEPISLASAYSEGGGHPWIRAAVERVLRDGAGLEGLVIGSTPALGVWLYNFLLTLGSLDDAPPLPPVHLCNISHLGQPLARDFNAASLRTLADSLDASPAALGAAIEKRNRVRALQRRIESRRRGPGPRLLGSHARRLLDAADTLAPGDYVRLVEAELAEPGADAAEGLTPIVLSAPGSPNLELYRKLEDRGLVVVADDMDFGSRAIGPDVAPGDPFEALAERYGHRAPAPSGWTTAARIDWLLALAREQAAMGVLFDLPNWAHSAAWDFPKLERALSAAGLRTFLAPAGASLDEAAEAAAQSFRFPDGGRRHG